MRTTLANTLAAPAAALLLLGCNASVQRNAIHASGHIEATEVRVAAKVGGRLVELPFWEGDAVSAGAVVARLDTIDAEHDLARARADLDNADARLRLLLAGTRKEDIARSEAELARAEADLAGAALDLRRLEGLADRGTATLKARDDARTRAEVLGRIVASDRADLAKARAGSRPEEIEEARASKAAAEATAAAIQQHITDATVQAPRDGVITERAAEPGEVLAPGALLYVLTDIAHPWLNAYVDEPSLARVRLGDPARVRIDGRSGDFTGKVTYVSDVAEFTPKNVQTPEERAKLVFRVKVGLDNPGRVFKPGMPADAYFDVAAGAKAR
ncbi:MAG: efflux RND transporter periplasmic adaptor subunit [Thermoanaerobaculaceae bacterium]|jgi:HlyD family secretion protein